jgi:hypothetical protein
LVNQNGKSPRKPPKSIAQSLALSLGPDPVVHDADTNWHNPALTAVARMGSRVVESLTDDNPPSRRMLDRLARELGSSVSTIRRAREVYLLGKRHPHLRQLAALQPGHVYAALAAPVADRVRLLKKADAKRLEVRHLRDEVDAVRRANGKSRHKKPSSIRQRVSSLNRALAALQDASQRRFLDARETALLDEAVTRSFSLWEGYCHALTSPSMSGR